MQPRLSAFEASAPGRRPPSRRPRLRIALVNNMPDAAVASTERQFTGLLAAAAGDAFEIELRLCALAGVPRGELARAAMQPAYVGPEALQREGVDAVIVTGAEPQAAELRDEPYWPELAALIDWARAGGARSALFSCLAAHVAVLHLDGVPRHRLEAKASGVFDFLRVGRSALTEGVGEKVRHPHSRLNGLDRAELAAHGYEVLTWSPETGVDLFVRHEDCLLVFLQGHPEYDADSLLREYRRDLGRVRRGERASAPRPRNYFDAGVEATLAALEAESRLTGDMEPLLCCDRLCTALRPRALWRGSAVRLFRNWLGMVAKAKRVEVAPARLLG